MKISELLLQEESLQQLTKQLLKPSGTIAKVMGDDASAVAGLLEGKTNDAAFVIRGESPMSAKILKAIAGGRPFASAETANYGTLKTMRMPGGARLVVTGGDDIFIITNQHHKDQLVG